MKLAIITIGDEILSGFTVNTNLAWIGQVLLDSGIMIDRQLTICDKKEEIIKQLDLLTKEKYTHILVTGGLGPTIDDVTPSAFYEYFGSKAIFDKQYWEYLKKRFKKRNIKIPEMNKNQAMYPDNGIVLNNPIGSARGLYYKINNINYFAMPGVPTEMKTMMQNEVLPIINKGNRSQVYTKTIRTIGLGESSIAEMLDGIVTDNIKIAYLPQLGRVDIRIFSYNRNELEDYLKKVEKLIGDRIYGYNNESIEDSVAKLLFNNNLKIATAESCTGGLLAHRLTNVSGSSRYMEGGIVCYNNDVKIEQVGVKKQTIIDKGAVSKETAYELAEGIRTKFNADVGIGITGIAGPTGGTVEKPVGLVYIGLSIKGKVMVKRFQFVNDRKANKLLSCQTALDMLRIELEK